MSCDDPAIREQVVCNRTNGLLNPQTSAVLFSLQTGLLILSLRSPDDRQHPARNQLRRPLHGFSAHLYHIQSWKRKHKSEEVTLPSSISRQIKPSGRITFCKVHGSGEDESRKLPDAKTCSSDATFNSLRLEKKGKS